MAGRHPFQLHSVSILTTSEKRRMKFRSCFFVAFAASLAFLLGAGSGPRLEKVQETPKGLPKNIAAALGAAGWRVAGTDGPACELWPAKVVEKSADFEPTLSVKYPFAPGAFVGVLRVPEGSKFSDFREQPIAAGVYTLRYAHQPTDGNHVGTSDLSDFLLAVPAAGDAEPAPIKSPEELHSKSTKASGTTHPAIFSLLPPPEAAKEASLEQDEARGHWILNTTVSASSGGKTSPVPLRLVVIGHAEI
jgi:hypothetical protein